LQKDNFYTKKEVISFLKQPLFLLF